MQNKFYVYRFLDVSLQVIYIGRTNDLKRRIEQEHFSKYGHLPKECYNECKWIEFMEFDSETEMKIFELYLINKYSPKYNVMENRNDNFTFILKEHWTKYKNNDIMNKKEYKIYSYIVMHSNTGKRSTTTTMEDLAEGLKMKHKDKVWKLLESLERKGYIYVAQFGRKFVISHTLRDIKFPKE